MSFLLVFYQNLVVTDHWWGLPLIVVVGVVMIMADLVVSYFSLRAAVVSASVSLIPEFNLLVLYLVGTVWMLFLSWKVCMCIYIPRNASQCHPSLLSFISPLSSLLSLLAYILHCLLASPLFSLLASPGQDSDF